MTHVFLDYPTAGGILFDLDGIYVSRVNAEEGDFSSRDLATLPFAPEKSVSLHLLARVSWEGINSDAQ